MTSGKRQAGFTLIEVLVALAIIGLALGALAGIFSTDLTAHETTSEAEAALAVAEEQLALAAAAPHPGTGSGVFANRYAWQTVVAPYQDAASKTADAPPDLPPLYRIAVSVGWRDGNHARAVSLSTLRLGAPSP
ncbi:MAG TPA: prepilin-type N-terminal cleavage/methylation domain-containing protein [Stellaceae bacterium]|nr:prepilin-type N-terminal cleavage/methylation domain-containing protein [Stellaceae bacterium]